MRGLRVGYKNTNSRAKLESLIEASPIGAQHIYQFVG